MLSINSALFPSISTRSKSVRGKSWYYSKNFASLLAYGETIDSTKWDSLSNDCFDQDARSPQEIFRPMNILSTYEDTIRFHEFAFAQFMKTFYDNELLVQHASMHLCGHLCPPFGAQ